MTSKGIIEDCSDIKFAPYNWNYPELEVHYRVMSLEYKSGIYDLFIIFISSSIGVLEVHLLINHINIAVRMLIMHNPFISHGRYAELRPPSNMPA